MTDILHEHVLYTAPESVRPCVMYALEVDKKYHEGPPLILKVFSFYKK